MNRDLPEEKKVVFIMGSGHCGSTLLDLILGSHSTAFSLGEFWSITQRIDSDEEGFFRICGVCEKECEFWNGRVSSSVLRSYFAYRQDNRQASKLFKRFGSFRKNIYEYLFEASGARVLVDSSKTRWWLRRQLRPFWHWRRIVPYLIYLTRDGRAVTNSVLRKYPDRDMESVAAKWANEALRMERYFEAFSRDRRKKVSYEELVTNPDTMISSICRLLNIPYEAEMLCYWRHDHHIVAGNLGTRLLIFKYREAFENTLVEYWSQVNQEGKYYDQVYYDQVGLAIKLDLRWRHELSQEQLEIFTSIAGKVNEPYAYDISGEVTT